LKLSPDLDVPDSVITQKLAVIAESGAGKTYTAGVIAEGILTLGAQVIVCDPVGVWRGLKSSADGKSPGFAILILGGDHQDLPLLPESGELVGRVLAERAPSAVLDVSGFTSSETKRFMRDFAESFFQAKKKHKGAVHLILEEAQTFVPQNPERDETLMLNRLERLLKIGRNYGVGWTLVTQHPQSVHKRVLNLAGTVIALRMSGSHERKALAMWTKDNASPADVDLVGDLPGLDTGVAHIWSPSFLKISKRVRIRKKVTFDASATPEVGQTKAEPKAFAPVEIEQLRADMEAMVEQAAAADPTALQKRLDAAMGDNVRLRAELVKLKNAPPPRPLAPPIPVELTATLTALTDNLAASAAGLSELAKGLTLAVGRLAAAAEPRPGVDRTALAVKVFGRSAGLNAFPTRAPNGHAPKATTTTDPIPPELLAYVKLLCTTAASRLPMKPTVVQLAQLAGRSHNSSSFEKAMGAITTRGLMVREGKQLVITDAGLQLIDGARPEPTSPGDLRRTWLNSLPTYESKLLAVLFRNYPMALPAEDLARLAEVSTTSSSWDRAIGSLKRNELIGETGRRVYVATATLFPEAAS